MTNLNLETYLNSLNPNQRQMHDSIKALIQSVYPEVEEVLFARQPYFYIAQYETVKFHERPSIMLSFFGDHVNVFATSNRYYQDQLKEYVFTEKHTMQIRLDQTLRADILKLVFKESLVINHS